MTEERMKTIEENIAKVSTIIDAVIKSDRKDAIVKMLEDDTFGQLYFTAPASSREQYHYAWAGGLVSHSLNVYKNLRLLSKTFDLGFDEESMCIVSLFHDLGKACASDLKNPHYAETTEDWKIQKGWLYEYGTVGVYMPTHQRSLFILQHFGIKLTDEEYQAILLHDGMYVQENRGYGLKECSLALHLHMADRIVLMIEQNE